MNNQNFTVTKLNGDSIEFDEEILKKSLRNCGASQEEVRRVAKAVQDILYEGISTTEIYKKAFSILKIQNRLSASKYSLKRAILALGPTGYPFERLVAALLQHKGYKTKVGVVLKGKCVSHEVDVLAEKDGVAYAVECKFKSDSHANNGVQIPLYINSRFLDLQSQWNSDFKRDSYLKQGLLVTNTRFSNDAIAYAECVGLQILGWNYPKNNGIKHNIDDFGLYPVTTMITLALNEKKTLIENGIILTIELLNYRALRTLLKISAKREELILNEAKTLVNLRTGN